MAPAKAPAKTWVFFVDYKFKAIGSIFSVNTTAQDTVFDLKEKAIKVSRKKIVVMDTFMWKTKGTMVIDPETTPKRLEEILRNINVRDKNTIEQVLEIVKVKSLALSSGQVLLMQVPGTSSCTYTTIGYVLTLGIGDGERDANGATTSDLDPAYKDTILHALTKGKFIEGDFSANYVADETSEVPEFVRKYEEMLGRKRKVLVDVRCFRILSCFRLLTDEVRCRLWIKRFSTSTLIVRQRIRQRVQWRVQRRIPPGPLPLPTDSRLNIL